MWLSEETMHKNSCEYGSFPNAYCLGASPSVGNCSPPEIGPAAIGSTTVACLTIAGTLVLMLPSEIVQPHVIQPTTISSQFGMSQMEKSPICLAPLLYAHHTTPLEIRPCIVYWLVWGWWPSTHTQRTASARHKQAAESSTYRRENLLHGHVCIVIAIYT